MQATVIKVWAMREKLVLVGPSWQRDTDHDATYPPPPTFIPKPAPPIQPLFIPDPPIPPSILRNTRVTQRYMQATVVKVMWAMRERELHWSSLLDNVIQIAMQAIFIKHFSLNQRTYPPFIAAPPPIRELSILIALVPKVRSVRIEISEWTVSASKFSLPRVLAFMIILSWCNKGRNISVRYTWGKRQDTEE
jgi:hypothetical protein